MSNTFAIFYLVSAALFILGLKGLTSPATARRGNYLAMAGMVIAIVTTFFSPAITHYGLIIVGVLIGAVAGLFIAKKIQMTAMPQLVAALHSFVGMAAVLVAVGTFLNHRAEGSLNTGLMVELFVGTFIGAITCTGSVIAFGKLQGLIGSAPMRLPKHQMINLILAGAMLFFGFVFFMNGSFGALIIMTLIALVLGVMLIIPIGGADMPVVISMLNSYSGWAAAATGFTLQNNLLIIVGALVGFSGAILSTIMCRAMNRSLFNVIFGGFGSSGDEEASPMASAAGKGVKSAAAEDAVFMMENASNVVFVPGYGMAVAQAQHALKEVVELLQDKGVTVKFAIHPVAGRMPGHMNVLLAEADIPYDIVVEMEEVNPEFPATDVVVVIGANDVVNPAAKTDPSSPIYGMPILEVDKAGYVFVIKRSMRPGYSGVENELFYRDNCSLIFGDAKDVCEQMGQALRDG